MTKGDLFQECKIGLIYKNHSVSYMRSLALGQNCVCDLSGLTLGRFKGFTPAGLGEKAALHTPDGMHSDASQALRGGAVKGSGPQG